MKDMDNTALVSEVVKIEALLKEPFAYQDVEWRILQAWTSNRDLWAKCLTYITSRAIQDRLDEVFGIDGWWDEYYPGPNGGVMCKLTVVFPDDQLITKCGIADNTAFEAVKGGESGALKRAAVKFGIGRYLYNLHESWAIITNNGVNYHAANDKKGTPAFNWNPPQLPVWALPKPKAPATTLAQPPVGATNTEKVAEVFDGTVQSNG